VSDGQGKIREGDVGQWVRVMDWGCASCKYRYGCIYWSWDLSCRLVYMELKLVHMFVPALLLVASD
jgi:hypothetical protein